MKRLGRLLGNRALRPVLVVWAFAYLLADITVTAMGRMGPGVSTIVSVPLFVLGITLTMLLEELRQRLKPRLYWMRWAGLGVAVLAATVLFSFVDLYYFRWLSLALVPEWQRWAIDVTPERLFTVGMLYLWTFCLVLTLLWAAGVGSAAERARMRASLSQEAKERAEAAALRLQLNPHFLFNALNSIASLVTLERKSEAERMIDQLSDFLRASLASDPMADVPLADELDTIDAYLGIETARFGERLEVEIEVEDGANEAVVPNFILQPLVENAIKHGVARVTGAARIEVTARPENGELVLSVVNRALDPSTSPGTATSTALGTDAAQDAPAEVRKGIGLDIVRQRLWIEHGERGRLETGPLPDGYRAVIRMPLEKAADRAAA
jgi:two-component system, LytTR family, sensor kinase